MGKSELEGMFEEMGELVERVKLHLPAFIKSLEKIRSHFGNEEGDACIHNKPNRCANGYWCNNTNCDDYETKPSTPEPERWEYDPQKGVVYRVGENLPPALFGISYDFNSFSS